jgi:hypothetical protein
MDDADLHLRNLTYRRFVELGRAPTAAELAADLDVPETDVLAGWRRLHDDHAIVLDADGSALLMANPFSAVPTDHRVEAAGRSWFANCAWDAFGIGAALGVDCDIRTSCPDCGESIDVAVRDARPDDDSLVFHVLVPAARWWADIGYT